LFSYSCLYDEMQFIIFIIIHQFLEEKCYKCATGLNKNFLSV
jgi:hypothetical protein